LLTLAHLVDTNLLLRRQQPSHPQAVIALDATNRLKQQGERLCIARQNLIEFRSTASRPADKNEEKAPSDCPALFCSTD